MTAARRKDRSNLFEHRAAWISRSRSRLRIGDARLASDALWSLASKGGRALTSLGTFLLVTRALGVRDYGYFAGILAFAAALLPFANLGAGHVVMQRVARDPAQLPMAWGDALAASATGILVTMCIVSAAAPLLIPGVAVRTIVLLAASELLFVSVGQVVAFAYEARRRFWVSTVISTSYGLARFLTVLVLYLRYRSLNLPTVALALFVVATVHGIAVAIIMTKVSRPQFQRASAWQAMRTGSNYMFSQFSAGLQNDVDKTMLVSFGMPAAAGVYAAGYRVVTYSLLPVESVVFATYPRFFRRGHAGGIENTWRYARSLSRLMVSYGVLALIALMLLAPLIARLIGEGYAEVADVVRFMAALVVLQSVRNTLGNALTGANYQTYRTVIIVTAALCNIVLNLLLIPRYAWHGAMIATYVSESFLLLASLEVIRRKRRVEAHATVRTSTMPVVEKADHS